MQRLLMTAVVCTAMALTGLSLRAADDAKDSAQGDGKELQGVLIDTKCGADMASKDDPQQAAAKHPKACALKCGKDGGYAVIRGKDMIALDDKGNKMATEYLQKEDTTTDVIIIGTLSDDGKTVQVTEIRPGEKAEGERES